MIFSCDEEAAPLDCAGVEGGVASIDDCGLCTGGTTGFIANYKKNQRLNQIRCNFTLDEIKIFSEKYKTNAIYQCIDLINDTKQNITKNLFMPLLITTFYIEIFQTLNKNLKK